MKIIVTGGAGFIGSNLCEKLVSSNHELTVIDDLSSGYYENLSSIKNKIEFIKVKVEEFDFSNIENISAVIHLAAQPSVPLSISQFLKSSSSNLLGSLRIIEYCRLLEIPLVYASSSAVYGNLEMGDDEKNKVDLLSPYAIDKYSMELYARTAHKLYDLSSIGLRFFNVYGSRQDPTNPYSGVISIFVDKLIKRQNIIINGGYQTRDFIFINDVVDFICQSLKKVLKNNICEVTNILTGKSVSIDYLANIIMEIEDREVKKIYKKMSKSDPIQSDGTTKKIKSLFACDLEKLTSLEVGLKSTIKYMKSID